MAKSPTSLDAKTASSRQRRIMPNTVTVRPLIFSPCPYLTRCAARLRLQERSVLNMWEADPGYQRLRHVEQIETLLTLSVSASCKSRILILKV